MLHSTFHDNKTQIGTVVTMNVIRKSNFSFRLKCADKISPVSCSSRRLQMMRRKTTNFISLLNVAEQLHTHSDFYTVVITVILPYNIILNLCIRQPWNQINLKLFGAGLQCTFVMIAYLHANVISLLSSRFSFLQYVPLIGGRVQMKFCHFTKLV